MSEVFKTIQRRRHDQETARMTRIAAMLLAPVRAQAFDVYFRVIKFSSDARR
jgi:hypothetical protein